MLTQCFALFLTALILCLGQTSAVCGNVPTVWRNNNITCPERAVCADVFETTRDWYNGTRCEERRVLHNCMCPGGTICPYENDAHRLFASRRHQQFTCRPVCTLPYCSNVTPEQRPNGRPGAVVSLTSEQSAEEFGDRTYYKMMCRCPRHHTPSRRVGLHRSVKAYTHRYNYQTHRYSTLYICDNRGNENMMSDPCDA